MSEKGVAGYQADCLTNIKKTKQAEYNELYNHYKKQAKQTGNAFIAVIEINKDGEMSSFMFADNKTINDVTIKGVSNGKG